MNNNLELLAYCGSHLGYEEVKDNPNTIKINFIVILDLKNIHVDEYDN